MRGAAPDAPPCRKRSVLSSLIYCFKERKVIGTTVALDRRNNYRFCIFACDVFGQPMSIARFIKEIASDADAAFLAAVFVVNRLAAKLILQEQLATQRGNDLHIQQSINRLVVADMGDGILVVGHDSVCFHAILRLKPCLVYLFRMEHRVMR